MENHIRSRKNTSRLKYSAVFLTGFLSGCCMIGMIEKGPKKQTVQESSVIEKTISIDEKIVEKPKETFYMPKIEQRGMPNLDIARSYGIDYIQEGDVPECVKKIKIAEDGYVLGVNKTTQRLSVYEKDSGLWRIVKEYDISTGKNPGDKKTAGDGKTPEGYFRIISNENSSDWKFDGKHAYGDWFLRLSGKWRSIGIHGTDEPDKLGMMASHGCIRLSNKDIREVKEKYGKIGTYVIIFNDSEADGKSLVTYYLPEIEIKEDSVKISRPDTLDLVSARGMYHDIKKIEPRKIDKL